MPSKEAVARKIQQLNALADATVKEDAQAIPCDTWSIFADGHGTCYRGEFPDLLHPNKVGYAKWATALRPIFAGLKPGQPHRGAANDIRNRVRARAS
jgi:hypothetical protein